MCKDGHPTTLSCTKNKKREKKISTPKFMLISLSKGIFVQTSYFLFFRVTGIHNNNCTAYFILVVAVYHTRIFTPNGANPGIRTFLVSIDFPRCRCLQAFCNEPQFESIFSLDSPFHLYPNS